jgi:hypothetical protein
MLLDNDGDLETDLLRYADSDVHSAKVSSILNFFVVEVLVEDGLQDDQRIESWQSCVSVGVANL